ncbi:cytochrome c oxidase assembly protein subunit 11 [Pseudooceanicola antarcticus]|uniref:Cytochrome c oxidase assembly protein CtaG n=1 Tax=Pseudooceanicola antarcticus TaxID=1247613 RepID=A0A285ISU9_9RHOB|nr:cytochrome c oxidase assembly protein [Pseudooceanicola antarcticus]PJE31975.1 cytochrome c oxidase assembly protein [Pseudooceanicola antarcticus]SNY51090.1 cytochrome c oxidase assembly protein subunit 11 [Pseudooceanicola antarcticus]
MDPKQKSVLQTVGVVVTMGALAWAAVPAYNYFCAVTGFGGVTQEADAGSDIVLDQTIKVRFDSATDRDMPWDFKPMQRVVELKIGETGLAFYEATNPTDRPIAGQASYNVTPYEAGGFFTKIDCFCFTEQVLEPGETVQMPVTFYVDPEIVSDRDAKYVHTITLGYTFYEIDLPEGYRAAEEQAALPAVITNTDVN